MCVIVDTNLAHEVFAANRTAEFELVYNYIESGKGKLVFGHKLATELFNREASRRRIAEFQRSGKAIRVPDLDVSAAITTITGKHKSNDPHVLGVALASGTRLLCTCDKALATDFKDCRIIKKPRGKVYKNSGQRALLRCSRGCPRGRGS